jgi:hypothetical protein
MVKTFYDCELHVSGIVVGFENAIYDEKHQYIVDNLALYAI